MEIAYTDYTALDAAVEILDPSPPRAEGYHVTDLIRAGEQVIKGKNPDETEEYPEGLAAMGKLWEYSIRSYIHQRAKGMQAHFDPQRVVEKDGIHGSLDGMLLFPPGTRKPSVVEIKCRFAPPSSPLDNHRWMAQCKAYCYMVGMNEVWMPILYLPHSPPRAIFHTYSILFSVQEIEENWAMLLNTKRYLEKREEEVAGEGVSQ